MSAPESRELALAAAQAASDGLADLLRFAREGETLGGAPLEEGTVEQLLDAAKIAIEIANDLSDDDTGQVYAAICRFLDGWA